MMHGGYMTHDGKRRCYNRHDVKHRQESHQQAKHMKHCINACKSWHHGNAGAAEQQNSSG
jgi:hypothetical protein